MVAKPVIVGLLGGIASGKSAVADLLSRRGALRIDADRIAHEVLASEDIVPQVREIFGPDAVSADGVPDRDRIGAIAFEDPRKLRALERIVHPRVRERIAAEIAAAADAPAVVLDVPLLLSSPVAETVHVFVFVDAPTQVRIDRARAHRGWSPDELHRREARQASLAEKERRAQFSIRNDGTAEDLERRAERLWREILDTDLSTQPETAGE
ncbi:MAG: dephospho-CoA kinase [Planctomycetota bacterium]